MTVTVGSNTSETIQGSDNSDIIIAKGGSDTIYASGGADLVFGGNGKDEISGGEDSDILFGGRGKDSIVGGADDDLIFGGNGKDTLEGGSGSDVVFGGNGADTFHYDVETAAGDEDAYFGGKGSDLLIIHLTQEQLDEILNTSILDDIEQCRGSAAVVHFSDYNLSFDIDLTITGIESIQFEVTTLPNTPPQAADDNFATTENEKVTGNLFSDNGNGLDIDPDAGDTLTVAAVDGEASSVGVQVQLQSGALVTVQADGSFEYLQNGAFQHLQDGETAQDQFSYTITDQYGEQSTATVTVDVSGETGGTIIGNTGNGQLVIDASVSESGDTTLEGIIDGGSFSSVSATIGNQAGSFGAAFVSGVWDVGADNFFVGHGGEGELHIADGGHVRVYSGTDDINIPGDFIEMVVGGSDGTSEGTGHVAINGAGSTLESYGIDAVVRVGKDGGAGSIDIEDGGQMIAPFVNIGRDNGIGTLNVDGAGSSIVSSGQYSVPFEFISSQFHIGRNGGTGVMNVSNEASVDIDATGQAYLQLGRQGHGTLNIDSEATVTMTGGPGDESGMFFRAGYQTGGEGFVNISDGGALVFENDQAQDAFFEASIGHEADGEVTVTNDGRFIVDQQTTVDDTSSRANFQLGYQGSGKSMYLMAAFWR